MIFAKYTFSEIKTIDILTFKTKNENEREKKYAKHISVCSWCLNCIFNQNKFILKISHFKKNNKWSYSFVIQTKTKTVTVELHFHKVFTFASGKFFQAFRLLFALICCGPPRWIQKFIKKKE